MELLVLGATGATGRHLTRAALAAGHSVTALVRRPEAFAERPEGLRVVAGDATRREDVGRAVDGRDAVLSALGTGSSLRSRGLFAEASRAVVAAAADAGTPRLLWLSSFGVGRTYAWAGRADRLVFSTLMRSLYADKDVADTVVRGSDLDWTVVLPSRLTDAPATGRYEVGDRPPVTGARAVARADVAHFMLRATDDTGWSRRDAVVTG